MKAKVRTKHGLILDLHQDILCDTGECRYCPDAHVVLYGHPDGEEILNALHGGMSRQAADLFCWTEGHESTSVYLQRRFDKKAGVHRFWAVHHIGDTECTRPDPAPESAEHKNVKAYIARALAAIGVETAMEKPLADVGKGARTTPDVTAYGPRTVSFEVQHSAMLRAGAVERTRRQLAHGMDEVVWTYDYPDVDWATVVPSLDISKNDWSVLPATGTAKVTGGIGYPAGTGDGGRLFEPNITLDTAAQQIVRGELVVAKVLGRPTFVPKAWEERRFVQGTPDALRAAAEHLRIECTQRPHDAGSAAVLAALELRHAEAVREQERAARVRAEKERLAAQRAAIEAERERLAVKARVEQERLRLARAEEADRVRAVEREQAVQRTAVQAEQQRLATEARAEREREAAEQRRIAHEKYSAELEARLAKQARIAAITAAEEESNVRRVDLLMTKVLDLSAGSYGVHSHVSEMVREQMASTGRVDVAAIQRRVDSLNAIQRELAEAGIV